MTRICLISCDEKRSEAELENGARVEWAAETEPRLEATVQSVLRAPTLESMLLRMEQIQVRAAPQRLAG